MNRPQPNTKKYKILLGALISIIVLCLALPAILRIWWLYAITVLIVGICIYAIYIFTNNYKNQVVEKKLCDCITLKEIFDLNKISAELGVNSAKTRGLIDRCFKKGYLDDYFRVGEAIRKKTDGQNDVLSVNAKKSPRRCNHCGAVANYYENEKAVCIYCGNIID